MREQRSPQRPHCRIDKQAEQEAGVDGKTPGADTQLGASDMQRMAVKLVTDRMKKRVEQTRRLCIASVESGKEGGGHDCRAPERGPCK